MKYYKNYLNNMAKTPNENYRGDMQSMIDQNWENTTSLYLIEEETVRGSKVFEELEVHVSVVFDETITGEKNGDDFRKIAFRDCDHFTEKGRMYRFNNNYWITVFTNHTNTVTQSIIARRCNNVIKWINEKGELIEYPCILDYTESATQPNINSTVKTAEADRKCILQGNIDTLTLDVNRRLVFSGKPFIVVGVNNYIQEDMNGGVPFMRLDLQLTTKQDTDDYVNNIADAYLLKPIPPVEENEIRVEPQIETILQGSTQSFITSVWRDGVEVDESIDYTVSGASSLNYELSVDNKVFTITNKKKTTIPLTISLTSGDLNKDITIKLGGVF